MSESIKAYPLQWPVGWPRMESHQRSRARFKSGKGGYVEGGGWRGAERLGVSAGISRVLADLRRMGVDDADIVISTNLPTRLDGLPRADARVPQDPGVAVYWRKRKDTLHGRRSL